MKLYLILAFLIFSNTVFSAEKSYKLISPKKQNTIKADCDSSGLRQAINLPNWLSKLQTEKQQDSSSVFQMRDTFYVSQLINEHNECIQKYYHKYLKKEPELKGTMVVKIYIHPSGKVNDVAITSSTLCHQNFENGILEIIKTWDNFGAIDNEKINIYNQKYIFGE